MLPNNKGRVRVKPGNLNEFVMFMCVLIVIYFGLSYYSVNFLSTTAVKFVEIKGFHGVTLIYSCC